MSYRLRAYGGSLLLHLMFLLIILLFSSISLQDAKRPLEIDLSLMEFEKKAREVEASEYALIPQPEKDQKESRLVSKISETLPVMNQPVASHKPSPMEEDKPIQEKAENPTLQPSDISTSSSAPSQSSTAQRASSDQVNQSNPTGIGAGAGKTGEESPQKTDTLSSFQQHREQYLKEKLSVISQIVQKSISYPLIARRMGWEGRVVLIIRLCEDGTLKEVKVAESSGYDILDRNAMETVKKVAHLFPKPPVEVVVKLPVSYRLE